MITHCVPTAPGRARLFFAMVTPAAGASALMRFAVTRMPHWLGHFSQHAVLDGDNCFLYMQARPQALVALVSLAVEELGCGLADATGVFGARGAPNHSSV